MTMFVFRAVMIVAILSGTNSTQAAELRFEIRFTPAIHSRPFTGRVYVFTTEKKETEPRMGPNWFAPEPIVSLDVTDWQPGDPLLITSSTPGLLSLPRPLNEWPAIARRVQAVARFNPWERNVGTGGNNGFSAVVDIPVETPAEPVSLTIDQRVPLRQFNDTEWSKLCSFRSDALSRFHGTDMFINAAVHLPASYYEQPRKRYPVIFNTPGFGGTHFDGIRNEPIKEDNPGGVEFIRVTLDPSCPWGHHVFADSANNGPWGTALVKEWLPEFEKRYLTVAAPHGRFVNGHSSGGWTCLWLQLNHRDIFGGVWSTAPDSIDFRDFSRVNIYRPGENYYRTAAGHRRPIARRAANEVRLWIDDFDLMERVLGHGGQFESFEAVFSPRGDNDQPQRLWDRTSGVINPAVAKAWEAYDINLFLERNWAT
ncbi:MAG TPA: hypothetical protein VFG20_17645, partial [Planctomycetaceae bacterium]|nr:hypothetical protein [Planctomycetaceae bacterium]